MDIKMQWKKVAILCWVITPVGLTRIRHHTHFNDGLNDSRPIIVFFFFKYFVILSKWYDVNWDRVHSDIDLYFEISATAMQHTASSSKTKAKVHMPSLTELVVTQEMWNESC